MKLIVVVVTIVAWLIAAPNSTWAVNKITFDAGNATINKYATFIQSIRNEAKAQNLQCYGIPMLPDNSTTPKFLLVELQGASQKNITLILKRNNLYVLGYSDLVNGKCCYHIFRQIDANHTEVMTTLCPNSNSREKKDINYNGLYSTLENKAGVDSRDKLKLGIQILSSYIGKISGNDKFTDKTEAEFLLVAIQMVSEAARFKYIENQVKTNFNREFNPNPKVISLEGNWGKISTDIHDAKNGALLKPLELKDASGTKWIVLRVDEMKPDVGLLNYVNGRCSQTTYQNPVFPQLIMSTYYRYLANIGDLFEGF